MSIYVGKCRHGVSVAAVTDSVPPRDLAYFIRQMENDGLEVERTDDGRPSVCEVCCP